MTTENPKKEIELAMFLQDMHEHCIYEIIDKIDSTEDFCTLVQSLAAMLLSDIALKIPEENRANFFVKFVYNTKLTTEARESANTITDKLDKITSLEDLKEFLKNMKGNDDE